MIYDEQFTVTEYYIEDVPGCGIAGICLLEKSLKCVKTGKKLHKDLKKKERGKKTSFSNICFTVWLLNLKHLDQKI